MMGEKKILVTEDGSHTIYLPELNETYHSTHGAIQESEYVFIQNGLDFIVQAGYNSIRIIEVGFGTGLNALLSLIYAEKKQVALQYQTIEAYPLDMKEILMLNYIDLINEESVGAHYEKLHQADWEKLIEISEHFKLKKIKGQIQEFLTVEKFDVCYFDAFAPSKQPEMWGIPVLQKIRDLLVEGGVFVTYCAKGQLKRDLKSLGFEVESLPGPPGKKEMVRATKRNRAE